MLVKVNGPLVLKNVTIQEAEAKLPPGEHTDYHIFLVRFDRETWEGRIFHIGLGYSACRLMTSLLYGGEWLDELG